MSNDIFIYSFNFFFCYINIHSPDIGNKVATQIWFLPSQNVHLCGEKLIKLINKLLVLINAFKEWRMTA